MRDTIKKNWQGLQERERLVLSWGALVIAALFFYTFIWQPWQAANEHMESVLPIKRGELVWMREQEENLVNGNASVPSRVPQSSNQSVMAILEQTAKQNGVRDAIKQLTPRQNGDQVSVVLEGVGFNKWVRWIDVLNSRHDVKTDQLTVEKEQADVAEIRMTVSR